MQALYGRSRAAKGIRTTNGVVGIRALRDGSQGKPRAILARVEACRRVPLVGKFTDLLQQWPQICAIDLDVVNLDREWASKPASVNRSSGLSSYSLRLFSK